MSSLEISRLLVKELLRKLRLEKLMEMAKKRILWEKQMENR